MLCVDLVCMFHASMQNALEVTRGYVSVTLYSLLFNVYVRMYVCTYVHPDAHVNCVHVCYLVCRAADCAIPSGQSGWWSMPGMRPN